MKEKAREILKLLSIPLILLAIYATMAIIWIGFGLPKGDDLVMTVREYFSKYGLWVIFISALIEGFFIVGQYFPGGIIIFIGVLSSGGDIPKAVGVVFLVSLAFFISYSLNYMIGKYGWYKLFLKFGLKQSLDQAKEKLIRQGFSAVIFSYWEPNLASVTATAAGILQLQFKKFLVFSGIGIAVWNTFWGTLVFSLGEAALQIIGIKYVLIIFSVWVVAILLKQYLLKKE